MEVLPQVHVVEGVKSANIYLIADDSLTLIDTGYPRNVNKILSYIETIGRRPQELSQIILTHYHPDHAGGAARLRALTGARVYAHLADALFTTEEDCTLVTPRVMHGKPTGIYRMVGKLLGYSSVSVEVVNDGDVIPCLRKGLRALHTPGHTPGSLCLYLEEKKALFTGDVLIGKDGRIGRPIPYPGANLEKSEQSLRKLLDYEVEAFFFAHGHPVLEDAMTKLHILASHPLKVPLLWRFLRRVSPKAFT